VGEAVGVGVGVAVAGIGVSVLVEVEVAVCVGKVVAVGEKITSPDASLRTTGVQPANTISKPITIQNCVFILVLSYTIRSRILKFLKKLVFGLIIPPNMSTMIVSNYLFYREANMADKKKSILDKAIDALTDRDEKAAAEEAAKKQQADKIMAEAKKAQAEKEKAIAAAEAKAKAEKEAAQKAAQEKLEAMKKEQEAKLEAKKAEIEKKRAEEAAYKAQFIKHVWTNEDTYASLAFKHYGSIKEAYWRLIYEHNKDIIGDHPNHIKTGTEIEIPPLPDELKKK
jgi:pyruvate/2-oxoglutarate dehydrogenase complex dihydrolipoamide acyltransferase (E2) component